MGTDPWWKGVAGRGCSRGWGSVGSREHPRVMVWRGGGPAALPCRLLGGEWLWPLRHLQVRLRPCRRDEHGGVQGPLGRGGLGAPGQVRMGAPGPLNPPLWAWLASALLCALPMGRFCHPHLGATSEEVFSFPRPRPGFGAPPAVPVPSFSLSICPSVRLQGPSERAGGGALTSQELLPLLPLQARHVEHPQQEAAQGLAPRARPAAARPHQSSATTAATWLSPTPARGHRCWHGGHSLPPGSLNEPQLLWGGDTGNGGWVGESGLVVFFLRV